MKERTYDMNRLHVMSRGKLPERRRGQGRRRDSREYRECLAEFTYSAYIYKI